jgi:hypothetical protein
VSGNADQGVLSVHPGCCLAESPYPLRNVGKPFVDLKIKEGAQKDTDRACQHDGVKAFFGYAEYFSVTLHSSSSPLIDGQPHTALSIFVLMFVLFSRQNTTFSSFRL